MCAITMFRCSKKKKKKKKKRYKNKQAMIHLSKQQRERSSIENKDQVFRQLHTKFYLKRPGLAEWIFLLNENFFEKKLPTTDLQLEVLRLKTQHFHTKLPYQKLKQIEWRVQNGSITKNGASNNFFFSLKILFQCKNLL